MSYKFSFLLCKYYKITPGCPDLCYLITNWDGCLRLQFSRLFNKVQRVVSIFCMNYGVRTCPLQFSISVLDLCQNNVSVQKYFCIFQLINSFSICIVCIQLETFSMESSVIFIKRLLLFM